MKSKSILTTFAVAVVVLFFASSVQASLGRLYPHQLINLPIGQESRNLHKAEKFWWTEIQTLRGKKYRVLTIEPGAPDTETDDDFFEEQNRKIYKPYNFYNKESGLNLKTAQFGMREYEYVEDGITLYHRIVTIESGPKMDIDVNQENEMFSPFNLVGTNNYERELSDKTHFSVKMMLMDDRKIYRVVTLEDF